MSTAPQHPPAVIVPGASNTIRAATVVKGSGQWREMADASLWLFSKGSQAVVAGPGLYQFDESDTEVEYRFYVWPSAKAVSRIWFVSLFAPTEGVTGTIESPDGSIVEFSIGASMLVQTVRVPEVVASAAAGEVIITITIATGTNMQVVGINAHELPRKVLTQVDTAYVPAVQTCDSGQPIYDEDDTDSLSINGVTHSLQYAVIEGRRAKLFDWRNNAGVVITATSFPGSSNIFSFNPAVLARGLYDPAHDAAFADRTVAWAVRAKVSGSTPSGEVKVTSNAGSGNTSTLTFTSTSLVWMTGTFKIKAEDPTTNATDGGLGTGRDELLFVARKTAGTSITINGIAVAEID